LSQNPVVAGANLTLTANGVSVGDGRTITTVEFYRDVNGNGILDPATDQLLAQVTNPNAGWYCTISTAGFPFGLNTYFARAQDNYGNWSDPVSAAGTVNPVTRIVSLSGSLAFGNVIVNSSKQSSLTIYNNGNSTMTVSSVSYPSGFSGSWSGTISAANSQNVTVTFSPTSATSYGGNISVNSDATSGASSIAVSGSGVNVQTNSFTNGLVAYYPFNGTANDASGNANNGIVNGTAAYETNSTGQIALQFNGTNNYVSLAELPTSGSGSFTIFAWVNDSIPGTRQTIVSYGEGSQVSDSALYIYLTDNNMLRFDLADSPGPTSPIIINNGYWYHVGVVNNNGNVQLYVNGVAEGSSVSMNPNIVSGFQYIGVDGGPNGIGDYFNGTINKVRIWNRALSASEIQQLYALEQPLVTIPVLGFGSSLWNSNGFNLILNGQLGSNYVIWSSTNLLNWTPLTNFIITNSPINFSDSAATNFNRRFYRAVMH
jgi:hypothetical protein